MHILYNFATRSRKDKAFACIDNIISLSRTDNYHIHLTLDVDDDTMNTTEVRDKIASYGDKVSAHWGISHSKVSAINRDIGLCGDEWQILCNHSDDMWFVKEGFDVDIVEAFEGFNGLVHFPDHKVKEALITYAMMHRDYYNIDGHIYHPDFDNVYCDNYQQHVAKARNKYKFVDKHILEHRHVAWGYGVADELLKKTENPEGYKKDHQTLNRLINEFRT